MELLSGLAPLILILILLLALWLVSRGNRVKPDGTKNTESHSANID